MVSNLVEIRGEIDAADMAVIDAVVQAAPGASRIGVIRQIIREWSDRELHRATLICRVAGRNGSDSASARNRGGSGAE